MFSTALSMRIPKFWKHQVIYTVIMVLLQLTSSLVSLKSSGLHGKLLNSKVFSTSVARDGVPPVQTLSVAPMMAHTNRHFRAFWRLISKQSVLYTEMVVADSIVDAAKTGNLFIIDKHYGHNEDNEDPLVLQLGGNDPDKLHEAAEIAYKSGFRSINLNCGCPSNTIASSNSMGAAMMYTPERTAECCAAVLTALTRLETEDKQQNNNSNLEQSKGSSSSSLRNFSVKCRTGVDELDSYEDLYNFINIVSSQGGVKRFQIHARKAILGVSTMANRDIPPLQYARVYRLVTDFPHLEFEINGAISSPEDVHFHLSSNKGLKGVMVGRSCINHPYMWVNTDRVMYSSHESVRSRGEIIEEYAQYCETVEKKEKRFSAEDNEKVPIRTLLAPVFNLFNGEDYCVKYRRELEKMSTRCLTPSIILRAAVRNIPEEALHGRRGEYRNNDEIIVHEKTKKSTGVMKITVS